MTTKKERQAETISNLLANYGWTTGRASGSYVDPNGRYRIRLNPRVIRLEKMYRDSKGHLSYVRIRSLLYDEATRLQRILEVIRLNSLVGVDKG